MVRRLRAPLVVAGAGVALVAIALLVGGGSDKPEPAPALPTAVLVGPRVGLADLRGEPAAVNFWASWCGPCRKETPEMERLAKSLARSGDGRLVGVDYTDNPGHARDFVREFGLTYPILVDASGEVGDRYGLTGLPGTAILDAKGNLVEVLRGPQDAASVKRALGAART